jgi:hypothetical protein
LSRTAVGRDERHAAFDELAEAIGLGVEFLDARDIRPRQQLRDEQRLVDEALLDRASLPLAHLPRDEQGGDEQRNRGRPERREEQLRAEARVTDRPACSQTA